MASLEFAESLEILMVLEFETVWGICTLYSVETSWNFLKFMLGEYLAARQYFVAGVDFAVDFKNIRNKTIESFREPRPTIFL